MAAMKFRIETRMGHRVVPQTPQRLGLVRFQLFTVPMRVMTELFSESRRTALRALCDTVVPRVEHDAPSHTSDQNRGEKPCC